MKLNRIVLATLLVASAAISSCKKNEGCTDKNSENYDSDAEKSTGCVYRYAAAIDIAGIGANNPNGNVWDIDGSMADLKIKFGPSSSTGYDFESDTKNDVTSATLTPSSNIQFTNAEWKYELVDDDLLSSPETIATGTFNPLTQGASNIITISNGGISIKFNYTVR